MELDALHQMDVYRRHFMDVAVWEPFVQQVCAVHGLDCDRVTAGVAGAIPYLLPVDEIANLAQLAELLWDETVC